MKRVFRILTLGIMLTLMQTQTTMAQPPDSTDKTEAVQPKGVIAQPAPNVNFTNVPTIDADDTVEEIAQNLLTWHTALTGIITLILGYVVRIFRWGMTDERKQAIQKWTALIIFLVASGVIVGKAAITGDISLIEVVGISSIVLTAIGLHTSIIKPLERLIKKLFSKKTAEATTA